VPSRKYFSEKVIPSMYEELRGKVKVCIDSVMCLALTMDYWISCAIDSYVSITAHFIDEKFKQRLAVLDKFPMCKRYTAHKPVE